MKTKNWLKIMGMLCLTVGLTLPVCGRQKNVMIKKASGVLLKNTYRPGAFTQIKVGGNFGVEVYPAEADSVVIVADEVLMPYIELGVGDRMINPRYKRSLNINGDMPAPLVKVYCRQLTGVEVSGVAELKTMGVCDAAGGKFRAHCSGAAEVTVTLAAGGLLAELSGAADATIKLSGSAASVMCQASGAAELELETGALMDFIGEVSGAADIKLSGSSETANMEASGAARLNARHFITQTAIVRASGGARAEVFVEKQLNATASGAGNIVFYGNPAYSANTSGAGTVSKR
ncbi:MAG: DUF2807 domain-containing protein [Bacteroidales bacterium]|nr:DUF2807 domain-containing protein [Bacteroidales bacterium]